MCAAGMSSRSVLVGRLAEPATITSAISSRGSVSARGQPLFRKRHDQCGIIGMLAFTPDEDDWESGRAFA